MYKIIKSATGKWVVLSNGNPVYSASTKKQAQAYIDKVTPK